MAFNPLLLLQGIPKGVYLGLLATAVVAMSFGGGYLYGGRNEARIQIKEVEKRIYVPVKEIQEVQVRNVERERVYQQQAEVARREAADLRRQMANLPSIGSTDCLPDDAVRLLNETIANGAPPNPPGFVAGSSDCVAPRDVVLWAADAATEYNAVGTRYNELIDWVEEELIEPQRTGD